MAPLDQQLAEPVAPREPLDPPEPVAPRAPQFAAQLAAAARALEAVQLAGLERVGDGELLQLIAASATNERLARAHSALLAGELARRSAPELGHAGLAKSSGYRTPQKLLQATTGVTSREAAAAVRVGGLADTHPWLGAVARAVADQRVSTDAADSIRAGLGMPSDDVAADVLADAATRLLDSAAEVDADRLFHLARDARDELDAVGIIDRERAARQARELRVQRLRDGSVRIVWQVDPLEGSVVSEIYDRATSPRRGGPPFPRGCRTGPADRRRFAQHRAVGIRRLLPADHGRRRGRSLAALGARGTRRARHDHREATRRPHRARAPAAHPAAGLARDGRASRLRAGHRRRHLRRARPAARRGARAAPLHAASAHRTRRTRRRMPLDRLRSAAFLVRSAPHRALGPRRRPNGCRRRDPLVQAPSPAPARPSLGDRAARAEAFRVLADPAAGSPRSSPEVDGQQEFGVARTADWVTPPRQRTANRVRRPACSACSRSGG